MTIRAEPVSPKPMTKGFANIQTIHEADDTTAAFPSYKTYEGSSWPMKGAGLIGATLE